jgi:hypothetical protein
MSQLGLLRPIPQTPDNHAAGPVPDLSGTARRLIEGGHSHHLLRSVPEPCLPQGNHYSTRSPTVHDLLTKLRQSVYGLLTTLAARYPWVLVVSLAITCWFAYVVINNPRTGRLTMLGGLITWEARPDSEAASKDEPEPKQERKRRWWRRKRRPPDS